MSDSLLLREIGQDGDENGPNEADMRVLQERQTKSILGIPFGTESLPNSADEGPFTVPQGDERTSIGTTGDQDLFYKTSEDSLNQISGNGESPVQNKHLQTRYTDTDSCLSVSPSPDPDSRKKTFDFSMIDTNVGDNSLTAAIQMEQEFLDFMFSLPQIQMEATDKKEEAPKRPKSPAKIQDPVKEEEPVVPVERPKKNLQRGLSQGMVNTSRVGLDHLDNLCRMMEQLGELREQNTRLQRRVQYLEELKTLQEMQKDVQDSIAARKTALSLGSVSLSDSELCLEDLKSCPYLLDSEESLDQPVSSAAKTTGQMLELPDSSTIHQRHSSSEEDRRFKDHIQRTSDKDKKCHKSAWGKVKHMISYNSKRENVRKKSGREGERSSRKGSHGPVLTKSFSVASAKPSGQEMTTAVATSIEGAGISDPEEYDLEYESMDPDGTSWDLEAEGEGGIWMGPKNEQIDVPPTDPPPSSVDNFLVIPKNKPQLTITVPSNDNLQRDDSKSGPDVSTTPPSPRRASNWSKVKQAFLTSPTTANHQPQPAPDHEVVSSSHNDNHHPPVHLPHHQLSQDHKRASHPSPTPKMKKQLKNTFSFDCGPISVPDELDSPAGASPEASPSEMNLQSSRRSSKAHSRNGSGITTGRHSSLPSSVVHKNLIDLQKTLTGEFSKKLQEWDRFRGHQGQGLYTTAGLEGVKGSDLQKVPGHQQQHSGEHLPHEFRKKLQEWEKMKGKDKEKGRGGESAARVHGYGLAAHNLLPHHLHHHHHPSMGQEDVKTKKHDESDLPPDFKKKLTEWEIRKALVGKGQQNVEQLQKNLGEEFNKKLAEWEKMKAVGGQGKISGTQGLTESGIAQLPSCAPATQSALGSFQMAEGRGSEDNTAPTSGTQHHHQIPIGVRISHLASGTGIILPQNALDRKGSANKLKKVKAIKADKIPLAKLEGGHKNRDKELLWLEKELNKVEREKHRLEREKEKFLEREARLEKMQHAMRQGPAEKKEIYIKTSTGEFRFEGISQTFTKKLYEWEERRGIRPESSTFVLLDPNYKAPVKEEQCIISSPQSPETKRITRSRSESSLAEIVQSGTISSLITHQSSLSVTEKDKEDAPSIQVDTKAVSEPTLSQDEHLLTPKSSVLVDMERLAEEKAEGSVFQEEGVPGEVTLISEGNRSRKTCAYEDPYAPAEITRLIDSSGSDENMNCREEGNALALPVVATNVIGTVTPSTSETDTDKIPGTDSQMSEEGYRSLLHENMTLLGKLKEQETLCRALETQMGDIDSKMDTVADQHLKTLEKLHRQVSIMKKSESFSRKSQKPIVTEDSSDECDEAESNQRLIEQLKARIVELELKGDKLMEEKEELECAFKLHKDHETQIAESLLIRIRELQDAGAEVNIQTVQCQTNDSVMPEESQENSDESKLEKQAPPSPAAPPVLPTPTKKKRRKRRDEYSKTSDEDEAYEEDKEESDEDENRRMDKDGKEQQKRKKKVPPKKVKKLHNLTADLLFQAKRLEGALVARHHLPCEEHDRYIPSRQTPKRSLRGRSSLRLTKDMKESARGKVPKRPGSSRTWSSIEAIASPEDEGKMDDPLNWETRAAALATESQDLLAMNAELSRMAKELRKEMMSVWSFRESTSPESNSSDGREETIKAKTGREDLFDRPDLQTDADSPKKSDEKDHWLEEEAKEVFDNIASLQPMEMENSTKTESCEMSDLEDTYKTSPTTISENDNDQIRIYDKSEEENQNLVESEEHFMSWWDVPYPKRRKSSTNQCTTSNREVSEATKEREIYPPDVETADAMDFEVVIPGKSGTRLSDLIHSTKEDRHQEEFNEETETLCSLRLSPFYNITSPRMSRISRASSTTSEEDKERKDPLSPSEMDDDGSTYGTLKTNASSTFKSDILSSSFEYEDLDKNLDFKAQSSHSLPPNNTWSNESQSQLSYRSNNKPTIVAFTPSQLRKVGKVVEEASLTMEEDKQKVDYVRRREKKERKSEKENERKTEMETDSTHEGNLDPSKYETEVRTGWKCSQEDRGLKARRVSDTQIEYEEELQRNHSFQENIENENYSYKRSRPVTRIPSIRRNQSESDVTWLQEENHQSSQDLNKETPCDVFVTTHRTIFTISGEGETNSLPTKVIPTFLEDYDVNDQDVKRSRNKSTKHNFQNNSDHYEGTQSIQEDSSRVYKKQSTAIAPPVNPPTFLDALSSSYHVKNQPSESKKKVLEAANEASPTVKNMIDVYNRRITENQELLINPFRLGDPFTENKRIKLPLAIDSVSKERRYSNKGRDHLENDVLKSQSAIILKNQPSSDNVFFQNSLAGYKNEEPSSAPIRFSDHTPFSITSPDHPIKTIETDKSFDLNVSTEYSVDTEQEAGQDKSRAIKIKKAKEEFLARGSNTPMSTRKRLSWEFESQSKPSNESTLTNGESNVTALKRKDNSQSDEMSASKSNCHSNELRINDVSVIRRESMKRLSESCPRDENDIRKNVIKSASSGLIELRKKYPQGRPPTNKENRKSCLDTSDSKRTSKGIFKLFRLSRCKERKDLSTVQNLCRQSLAVEVGDTQNNGTPPVQDGQQPSTSSSPPLDARLSVPPVEPRSSRTLPRGAQSQCSTSSSRSCHSSPVAIRKSRTSQWLAKGKNIFKNRSPSPDKRPR